MNRLAARNDSHASLIAREAPAAECITPSRPMLLIIAPPIFVTLGRCRHTWVLQRSRTPTGASRWYATRCRTKEAGLEPCASVSNSSCARSLGRSLWLDRNQPLRRAGPLPLLRPEAHSRFHQRFLRPTGSGIPRGPRARASPRARCAQPSHAFSAPHLHGSRRHRLDGSAGICSSRLEQDWNVIAQCIEERGDLLE